MKARDRAYYQKTKGRRLLEDKAWRLENPEQQLLDRVRVRARNRGLDFDLEISDLRLPSKCPVLGIPIVLGGGKPQHGTPTVDRIDNLKGYVKGNVAVISWRANRLKSDANEAELEAVLRYIRKGTQS